MKSSHQQATWPLSCEQAEGLLGLSIIFALRWMPCAAPTARVRFGGSSAKARLALYVLHGHELSASLPHQWPCKSPRH